MIKFFAFLVVFFLLVGVGSVCVGQLVSDTSIISLSGKDWSLKVDQVLQSSIDSRNTPYMISKSSTEKELFLQLATFEDCKSGVVQFKVDMLGLTAFKQLPLDVELDVKEYEFVNSTHAYNNSQVVVYRPENIVNSFALFDDSGRKQAHISASKLVASDGATVWCDSNLESGLLTVDLPLEWLEGAKFPVVLDPTFGYTSVGGSDQNAPNTYIIFAKYNLTDENVTVHTISWFGRLSANGLATAFIYSDNGGNPNVLLTTSDEISVSDSAAWRNFTLNINLENSGTYHLAVMTNQTFYWYFDTLESGRQAQSGLIYPVPPDPASGGANSNEKISIYADYTLDVVPTPTPSPSPSPSSTVITDDAKSNAMLFVLGFMVVMCVVSLVFFTDVVSRFIPTFVGLFTVLIGLYCGLGGVYGLGVAQGWFSLFVALFGAVTMLLVGLGVRVRK